MNDYWRPIETPPQEGEWVLMYLNKYAGIDRYRAGMYMGKDDWMSAANWNEPNGLLSDADVSHWTPLPEPPSRAALEQRSNDE